jgi:hypothetical protein
MSIPFSTATPVEWDGDDYDPFNMHDIVTNKQNIVIPETGYYFADVHIAWGATTNNKLSAFIKNATTGVTYDGIMGGLTSLSDYRHTHFCSLFHANAGEIINIDVWQEAVNPFNLTRRIWFGGVSMYDTSVSVFKVGI